MRGEMSRSRVTSLTILMFLARTNSPCANPGDGWRTIAPVGNLEGLPISHVGLDWEALNVGWNTSLTFDDTAAAGWQYLFRATSRYLAVPRPITSGHPVLMAAPTTPRILPQNLRAGRQPACAHFGSNIPENYSKPLTMMSRSTLMANLSSTIPTGLQHSCRSRT